MAIKGKKRKGTGGGQTPISSPTKTSSSSPAKLARPPSSSTPSSSRAASPHPSPPPSPTPGPGAFPISRPARPTPKLVRPVPPAAPPPPPSSPHWTSSVAEWATRPPPRARPADRKSVTLLWRLVSVAKRVVWYFLIANWFPVLMVVCGLAVSVPVLSSVWGWYQTIRNLVPSLAIPAKLASALLGPLASTASLPALIAHSYCSTIGIGCGSSSTGLSTVPPIKIGQVARKLREEASRASDIFQSVVELSDLDQMGLHQVEIWELAMAVKRGSKLQDKEILASSLVDLGDLTRDMKDKLIGINSEGINSFSWIVHEFTRLEASLLTLSPPPPPSPPATLPGSPSRPPPNALAKPPTARQMKAFQGQLTSLISHLSTSLSSLQASIESTLPLADRASRLGGQLQEGFFAEELVLETKARRDPVWLPLVGRAKELALGSREEEQGLSSGGSDGESGGGGGWRRSEGVKKDLKLTRETVGKLGDLRRGMEDLRSELVGYRDNVGWFRAGVVGWYLGGSDGEEEDGEEGGMDPELEMEGLRHIISKFSGAVQEAKTKGRGAGGSRGAHLPAEVGWGG